MVHSDHKASPRTGAEPGLPAGQESSPNVASPELSGDRHSAIAQSRLGRWFITFAVGLMAAFLILPNLPAGPFTDGADVLWSPAKELGIQQKWKVFSPSVRPFSIESKAIIEYDDGTRSIWQPASFDKIIGPYREYRWSKWEESLSSESRSQLWEPTALWLAEQHSRDGAPPVKITLIERKQRIITVGTVGVESNWVERSYYTWERDQ